MYYKVEDIQALNQAVPFSVLHSVTFFLHQCSAAAEQFI